MRRAIVVAALLALAAPLLAQTAVQTTIEAKVRESLVLQINGATAAYAIDESIATASGRDGLVTIFGKSAGTTRVMVIALGRTIAYDVVVLSVASVSAPRSSLSGSPRRALTEARYLSTTGQVQATIDTSNVHAVVLHDRTRTSIPSASVQVGKVTLLDKRVEESPLTSTSAAVRGFHFFDDTWRVHAGVTASTFYDSFVFPVKRQFVLGASRAWKLDDRWSVMPGIYGTQHGAIASLLAQYADGDRLRAKTEIGFSHGLGGAFEISALREKSQVRASLRYRPREFATLAPNDVRGFTGDLDASRSIGKLDAGFSATKTHTYFSSFEEHAVTSTLDLRYHVNHPVTLIGGATYGRFDSRIRSFTIPVGASLDLGSGGVTAIYRIGDNTSRGRSNGFRVSGAFSRSGFHASAFVDRQNDAPTIALFTEQYPELASDLARAGITATSIDDIARLLREGATLAGLGITNVPRVELALKRQQTGADLAWRELRLRYIRNDAETVSTRTRTTFTTLTWTHRLFDATNVEASYGVWVTNHHREPTYELAVRHRFDSLPSFGRSGEISGSVYRDDDVARTPLGGVEVELDEVRTTRTDNAGRYAFKGVAPASHRVMAHLPSDDAYFTTASQANVALGEHADFGVAFSPARLNVTVVDDSGRGISGVDVTLAGTRRLNAASNSEGVASFVVQPGTWTASIDDASIDAGYVIDGASSRNLALERARMQTMTFKVRASRSITGRIDGAHVRTEIDVEPGNRRAFTDENGVFAIRSLPAGIVTLHTRVKNATASQSIVLPAEPVVIDDVVLTPR